MAESYTQQPRMSKTLYSEDEEYPTNNTAESSHLALDPTSRTCSTSSLSDAMDPDADAEGEPDDLDADADGIEDDDGMGEPDGIEEDDGVDGNFDLDGVPTRRDDDTGEDEDEGDGDEEDEDDEDDDEGEAQGEDESGVEMDLDENASSPPPSPPSRLSEQTHQNGLESGKKPIVLKLKLASQSLGTHEPPAARTQKRKQPRKPTASKSTSNRSRSNIDKKANTSSKRWIIDEGEEELAEESVGLDSEMDDSGAVNQSVLYHASEYSDGASVSDDATPNVGQLTVRQRAKECGEPVIELQSLPMTEGKKKKELTEADRAMEKAEKSRKRKHQNEKKLEDEKTETINRLLKGQIGKAGRGTGSKIAVGMEITEENNPNQAIKQPIAPTLPTLIRRISSIKSGEYVSSLNLPSSVLNNQSGTMNHFFNQNSSVVSGGLVYPPPIRPPPKSWKLVNGVRVN